MVAAADGLEVPPHPCLVGDDAGVFGVCFPVPTVGAGGVVDGSSRDVDKRLVVGFEDADQERGTAAVQVGRPEDLTPRGESQNVGD